MTEPEPEALDWLHKIRDHELSKALPHFPEGDESAVLEVGVGTGYMLGKIKQRYRNAVGIEVAGSAYSFEGPSIRLYNGKDIPYPKDNFDVVFSSHVLEHVPDISSFLLETRRVLKKGGTAIHIIPSPTWRCLTSIMHYPALAKLAVSMGRDGGRESIRGQAGKKKLLIC